MFVKQLEINFPNTAVSRRSNALVLLDSEHRLKLSSTTTNYANVAYDLLPYNMASETLSI